jgi:RHS repeat-associated protein
VYDIAGILPVVLAHTISGGSAPPVRKYVWGAAGLAYAVGSDGSVAVYHADGLGSVRALTDAAGDVTQVYGYDAYGVPADPSEPSNPPDQPFRYAGEPKDYAAAGSGLVDLRARTYAPDLGRLLQRDPLMGSVASPQSLNRYAYVQSNPANLVDPSGLKNRAAAPLGQRVVCAAPVGVCSAPNDKYVNLAFGYEDLGSAWRIYDIRVFMGRWDPCSTFGTGNCYDDWRLAALFVFSGGALVDTHYDTIMRGRNSQDYSFPQEYVFDKETGGSIVAFAVARERAVIGPTRLIERPEHVEQYNFVANIGSEIALTPYTPH